MLVNGVKRVMLPPADMEKAYICSEGNRLQAAIWLSALQQTVIERQIAADALAAESKKQNDWLSNFFQK